MGVAHDVCADCVGTVGKLCDRCKPSVLPQLAKNIGWLKLMGEALVEQTMRQAAQADAAAVAKAKRRTVRKQSRLGYRGLLAHIQTAA